MSSGQSYFSIEWRGRPHTVAVLGYGACGASLGRLVRYRRPEGAPEAESIEGGGPLEAWDALTLRLSDFPLIPEIPLLAARIEGDAPRPPEEESRLVVEIRGTRELLTARRFFAGKDGRPVRRRADPRSPDRGGATLDPTPPTGPEEPPR